MSLGTQGVVPVWGDRVPQVPALLPYSPAYGLGGGQLVPHAAGPGHLYLEAAAGSPLTDFDDRPALEREIKDTVTGRAAQGQGGSFRLRPGWPQMDQLDYLQKLTTSSFLMLGLLLLAGYAIAKPGRAIALANRAAHNRLGAR